MKKAYVAPNVEVVKFDYSDQVVVASGNPQCGWQVINVGLNESGTCTSGWEKQFKNS